LITKFDILSEVSNAIYSMLLKILVLKNEFISEANLRKIKNSKMVIKL